MSKLSKAEGEAQLARLQAEQLQKRAEEDARDGIFWAPAAAAVVPAAPRRIKVEPQTPVTAAAALCIGFAEQGSALLRLGLIEPWGEDSSAAKAALEFLRHYTGSQGQGRHRSKRMSRDEIEEFEAYIFEAASVYPQPKDLYENLAKETGKTVGALRTLVHRIRKHKGIEVRGAYR